MAEQDLAVRLKESAERLRKYRDELVALVPEVEERCGPIDELLAYIESQSLVLQGREATGQGGPLA